ncbi:MAG: Wzz/FepE/Etk N-terminal domain-containing protein, partial [Opitutae bacterium]
MTEETKSTTKYVMVESSPSIDEDEIDLLELIRTLLHAWKTIFGITILCTGLAVTYALYTPEVFKAETLLAPASEEKSGGSSVLSQFGGLAAMAGISIPNDSNVEQVVATLKSRKFLSHYIDREKLLPVLFEDIWDAE